MLLLRPGEASGSERGYDADVHDVADYPNPDLAIEVDLSHPRSTGQASMPRCASPKSGGSMASAGRSSLSGWRTTGPTIQRRSVSSCQ